MSFFYIYPYQIICKNNTVNLFFTLHRLDEAAESRLQPIRIQSTDTSKVPTFRLLRTTAPSSCLQQAEWTLGNGKKVFYIYHPANAFFHRYCMIGKEKLRTSLPCIEQNQESLLKPIQGTTNNFLCRLRTVRKSTGNRSPDFIGPAQQALETETADPETTQETGVPSIGDAFRNTRDKMKRPCPSVFQVWRQRGTGPFSVLLSAAYLEATG